MDGHVSLFNRIAPVYAWFYQRQRRRFRQVIEGARGLFDLAAHETVLDVGSGTGALCSVMRDMGMQVTGVEPAGRMLAAARRQPGNHGIDFLQADALKGLPFADKAFDIVIASYVAHGMGPQERQRLYREMRRLSRRHMIIYDYNPRRSPIITLAERLEGGDYFNFIRVAPDELRACCAGLQVIYVDRRAAWYICTPG